MRAYGRSLPRVIHVSLGHERRPAQPVGLPRGDPRGHGGRRAAPLRRVGEHRAPAGGRRELRRLQPRARARSRGRARTCAWSTGRGWSASNSYWLAGDGVHVSADGLPLPGEPGGALGAPLPQLTRQFCDGSAGIVASSRYLPPLRSSASDQRSPSRKGSSTSAVVTIQASSLELAVELPRRPARVAGVDAQSPQRPVHRRPGRACRACRPPASLPPRGFRSRRARPPTVATRVRRCERAHPTPGRSASAGTASETRVSELRFSTTPIAPSGVCSSTRITVRLK